MYDAGPSDGYPLYRRMYLYPHSEPRLFGRSLQTHHQFCVYSTCRRRRISRNECHARSTLRYCPRTFLQRIRTWFGTYCGSSGTTRNPVRQALVSSTGTFWDTVIICALTGLVLVTSVLAFPDIDYTQGGALTKAAFGKIPYVGTSILAIGILTFAFSTILGWGYYWGKAIEYLGGKKLLRIYRVIWISSIYFGSTMNLQAVWNIADSVNALMAVPNLISLIFLSGVAVKETQKYLWENRLEDTADPEDL